MTTTQAGFYDMEIKAKGLAIDDDKVWQDNFSRYLSGAGLIPEVASSAIEAEGMLEKNFYHVALVDLSLVGDDNREGNQIIRKIYQQLGEGTEAILLTAYGNVEEGAEAERYGAFDVLSKQTLRYPTAVLTTEKAAVKARENLGEYHVGLNVMRGPGGPEDLTIHETNLLQLIQGSRPEADRLAANLFKGLYPVLRLQQAGRASTDREKKLNKGTYWSKVLTGPILVMIGHAESIENELSQVEERAKEVGTDQYGSVIRFERQGAAAGLVIRLPEPPCEQFDPRQDPSFRRRAKNR